MKHVLSRFCCVLGLLALAGTWSCSARTTSPSRAPDVPEPAAGEAEAAGTDTEEIEFDIQPASLDEAGTYHDADGRFYLKNAAPYALYSFPGSEEYEDALSTVLMTDNDWGTVGEIIIRELSAVSSLALGATGVAVAGETASREAAKREWNGEETVVTSYSFESPKTGKIYRVYLMPDLQAWFEASFGLEP